MKSLFDNLSDQVSRMTTRSYSTSFSLGIYFIDPKLRGAIYAIYGFVRIADEIVDSFEGFDKRRLLSRFREETYEAIENKISTNPVLNSFQKVVHDFGIDHALIETFLKSMEMDLERQEYNREKYEDYIFGSAEVVGLMCLYVFAENDFRLYKELEPYAMKLGSAFQKVNFLRDMKDDYEVLGRTYFPNVDMQEFSNTTKKQIEKEIEEDFAIALKGIKKLPRTCKGGVYLAYVYYTSLLSKIKKVPAAQILNKRIRIHNGKKFGLMINSLIEFKMNLV
jgi:15-cis-phytoene synthase